MLPASKSAAANGANICFPEVEFCHVHCESDVLFDLRTVSYFWKQNPVLLPAGLFSDSEQPLNLKEAKICFS